MAQGRTRDQLTSSRPLSQHFLHHYQKQSGSGWARDTVRTSSDWLQRSAGEKVVSVLSVCWHLSYRKHIFWVGGGGGV
uniref:Uncharacterized protein n=1 Tax=Anguilla anguilla TaxID=7936 RepID=A0A0E9WB36_ANGAN